MACNVVVLGEEIRAKGIPCRTACLQCIPAAIRCPCLSIDGDDPFLADLFHGVGHQVTDFLVAFGADGRDPFVILAAFNLLRLCRDGIGSDLGSFNYAALDWSPGSRPSSPSASR